MNLLTIFGLNLSPGELNFVAFIIGLLGYFVGEFKTRSEKGTSFSIKYWALDNKYNIMFYVLGVAAYFVTGVQLTPLLCLAAGYVPNTIMDQWQTFRQQNKGSV